MTYTAHEIEAAMSLLRAGVPRRAVAREAGIPESTLRGIETRHSRAVPTFSAPPFKRPFNIDELCEDFEERAQIQSHEQNQSVSMGDSKPHAILFFGDPHLDDNGTNWPLLRSHIEIAKHPRVLGFQVGDIGNNWPAKLAHLWAKQGASEDQMWQRIDWFLNQSGITWLGHVFGNHDRHNNGRRVLKLMHTAAPFVDWSGRFKLTYPNGADVVIDAEHGRKGRSMWNELHGAGRDSVMRAAADIFVDGHTHNFGIWQREIPARGYSAHLIKVRGYKFMDEFARHNGFSEYSRGSAVLCVIRPGEKDRFRRVTPFEDISAGMKFLEAL